MWELSNKSLIKKKKGTSFFAAHTSQLSKSPGEKTPTTCLTLNVSFSVWEPNLSQSPDALLQKRHLARVFSKSGTINSRPQAGTWARRLGLTFILA